MLVHLSIGKYDDDVIITHNNKQSGDKEIYKSMLIALYTWWLPTTIPTYYDIILPTTTNLHYNWISRMYLRCFVANMNIEMLADPLKKVKSILENKVILGS